MVRLTEGFVYFPWISYQMSLVQSLLIWLVASAIVFLSFIIKYVLINLFIGLFKLGDFKYIQHFNSLRFSLGAFILVFILVIITFLTYRTGDIDLYMIFIQLLVVLLLIRIVILFFKLRDHSLYKNFHLFSYLCGTEIIPFVILYKIVLG